MTKARTRNGVAWRNFPAQTSPFVVYLFRCPITNEPRYVGATDDLKKRVSTHFWKSQRKLLASRWIESLRLQGMFPVVEILGQHMNDGAAAMAEQRFIDLYTNEGLLNQSRHLYSGKSPFQKEDVEFPNRLRVLQVAGRPSSTKIADLPDDSLATRTIKVEMRWRGISLATLAKQTPWTYQAIAQWLCNKCKPPIDAALRLCELFCFRPEEWIQPCQSTPAFASTTPAPSPDPSVPLLLATSKRSVSLASFMSV